MRPRFCWISTKQGVEAQIILSHLHLDHIMGLPHFAPFWRGDSHFVIHAPEESVGDDPDATLFSVLRPPLFPMDRGALPAAIEFRPYRIGAGYAPTPEIRVSTVALSHNGASAAIIVEADGRKLCYATDHEHGDSEADARLAAAAEGADLLIYDATFAEAEWPAYRGWGHSTWEEGLRLKRRAGVKLLALAHHEPGRTDAALNAFGEAVAERCANAFFSRARV
jgi:ribonuclease BN (tRNA processing enzyme)